MERLVLRGRRRRRAGKWLRNQVLGAKPREEYRAPMGTKPCSWNGRRAPGGIGTAMPLDSNYGGVPNARADHALDPFRSCPLECSMATVYVYR